MCLLVSLLGLQCIESPLEPVAPSSDIQLSIPLINRTKYLSDLTSKDTLLKATSDGGYYYSSSQNVKPIGIDTIKVTPKQTSQQIIVGNFTIDPPASVGDTVIYKEITGVDPPVIPTVTPSQMLSIPNMTTGAQASFDNATFESGTVSLLIRNKFPFAIDFPNPIIVKNYKMFGPIDTNEVVRFAFGGITLQPGEARSVNASLANQTVQSSVRVPSFLLHAQASGGAVTLSQQSGIEYVVSFSTLIARSARATIPAKAVSRSIDSVFTVDDSLSLQSAYFRSGAVNIVLQNNIDIDATVSVRFNELQDKRTGAGYSISNTFHGKGSVQFPVDASTLRVQSSVSTVGTKLSFTASMVSVQPQFSRQVSSTDFFKVDIQPQKPFVIQSVTGRIKPTSFSISSGASGPNFGDITNKFTGNITFDSVKMTLKLAMATGFPTDYSLRLVAMNRHASPTQIDSLVLPPPVGSTLPRFFPGPGNLTQIVLDNSSGLNRFLSRFFPSFPDTFIVRGSALMNPPDIYPTSQGIQTVYDTSKVYASIDVWFPIKLALANGQISDTSGIDHNNDASKDFSKATKSATAYFEVTNGLPIQLIFRAALLRKSAFGRMDTILWLPSDGPRTIVAAAVDQNGNATGPKVSSFSVRLLGSDAEQFNNADALWYKLQVETTGGGTVPVRFRQQDFVTVRASANMVYTINKQ